jgi:uncharacterized protein (DUF58 family)
MEILGITLIGLGLLFGVPALWVPGVALIVAGAVLGVVGRFTSPRRWSRPRWIL